MLKVWDHLQVSRGSKNAGLQKLFVWSPEQVFFQYFLLVLSYTLPEAAILSWPIDLYFNSIVGQWWASAFPNSKGSLCGYKIIATYVIRATETADGCNHADYDISRSPYIAAQLISTI
jgi:hypothetical protein